MKRRSSRGRSGESDTTASANSKPFAVMCKRQDGRDRLWMRYADRAEAEAVAQHLVAVGCPARVQRTP